MATFQERAISYIESHIQVDADGCWIPKNKPRVNGYVRASFMGKSWYLHRLSFNAFNGEIKPNNDVCHKCDVRECCNPEHLFQGSRKVNMQDAVSKGRQARGLMLPQAKLSEEDKECILYLVKKGCKYHEIAPLFNVTRHSIGQVAIKNNIRKRTA